MTVRILNGDCRAVLTTLPSASVHCIVVSPPYYGLRDYGTAEWEGGDPECDHKQGRNGSGRADGKVDGRGQRNRDGVGSMGGDCRKCGARRIDRQVGLESTPDAYVAEMVAVFREARRVLRDDGTLWLNLGDSYNNFRSQMGPGQALHGRERLNGKPAPNSRGRGVAGLKEKDLIGIPWRVAFALQADGWYLRQDIIWSKPNAMPESVTDRCTKAHEYVFMLSKSARYFYDADAISEPCVDTRSIGRRSAINSLGNGELGNKVRFGGGETGRNRRSVWTIATQPYGDSHFATMPPDLAELCIKAGCPKAGTVLDPFGGAGTTGLVADRLGRDAILIELNPDYAAMARRRIESDGGMFSSVLEAAE